MLVECANIVSAKAFLAAHLMCELGETANLAEAQVQELRAGARKNVVSAMETLRRTSTVLAQVNPRPKEEKFLFHLRHRALNSCRERRMAPMLSLPAHLPRYVNGALAFNSEHSNAGFRFSAARYPFQIWYLHWL